MTDDPQAEDYRIYRSRRTEAGWSEAERVDLGGEFSDLYPTLTHDGQRLAFTSYRPFPGDTSAHPSANLWYADRRGDGWATPVPITSAVRPGYYHSQVWFGPGDSLIVRATTPDWETTTTLVSVWSGTGYAAPVPYDPVERWADWRPDLHVWGGVPGPGGQRGARGLGTGRGWQEARPDRSMDGATTQSRVDGAAAARRRPRLRA